MLKKFKWVAGALVVGAVIGFGSVYIELQDARAVARASEQRLQMELASTREKLLVAEVHGRLAILAQALREGDLAAAERVSTKLFDHVTEAADQVQDADSQRRLLTVSRSRDEVTKAIAVRDPQAAATVERLFGLMSASVQ